MWFVTGVDQGRSQTLSREPVPPADGNCPPSAGNGQQPRAWETGPCLSTKVTAQPDNQLQGNHGKPSPLCRERSAQSQDKSLLFLARTLVTCIHLTLAPLCLGLRRLLWGSAGTVGQQEPGENLPPHPPPLI